jgi:hypothetical protein
MRVSLNYLTFDDCVKNGVDIRHFLDLLAPSSTFEHCEVSSSWGLLLFSFHRSGGSAAVPVSLDVFKLLDGAVVNDSGVTVERWDRLAEELISWADQKAKRGHAPVSTQTKRTH